MGRERKLVQTRRSSPCDKSREEAEPLRAKSIGNPPVASTPVTRTEMSGEQDAILRPTLREHLPQEQRKDSGRTPFRRWVPTRPGKSPNGAHQRARLAEVKGDP